MKIARVFAVAFVPLALAAIPAPAGNVTVGCGVPAAIQDPDIRASFERFDRTQSAAAAKLCAIALNSHLSQSAAR